MGETSLKIMFVLFNVIFVAFIAGILLFIYQYKLKKKKHDRQLLYKDETHKKELLKTQIEIQTDTMRHIGQDIHDSVGQKLTLASLYLKQLPADQLDSFATTILSVNQLIDDSLEELRQVSKSLTQSNIMNQTLIMLLEQLSNRVTNLNKFKIDFQYQKNIIISSVIVKTVAYRIAQEFIQNSIKHSKCSLISLKLSEDQGIVTLALRDDGVGFNMDTLTSRGIGISNFKKRADWIGAKLYYKSKINQGTQLTLVLPENEL